MIALLLSMICSTYLVVVLRYFRVYDIDARQAIVVNYITCVITGMAISGDVPTLQVIDEAWFPLALFLGCSFLLIFNLMAFVSAHISITLTSVAGKISMVIPVTVAVFLYGQEMTIAKSAAMLLALAAVYLVSKTPESNQQPMHAKGLLLAFLIFIGSGINDSVINYALYHLLAPDQFALFNIMIFGFAALTGAVIYTGRFIFFKAPFSARSVAGGIMLGIPNYFSMMFLLEALANPAWESSVIFPLNNMGIVVLTACCGLILFRERFGAIHMAGLLLALVSIALMIGAGTGF